MKWGWGRGLSWLNITDFQPTQTLTLYHFIIGAAQNILFHRGSRLGRTSWMWLTRHRTTKAMFIMYVLSGLWVFVCYIPEHEGHKLVQWAEEWEEFLNRQLKCCRNLCTASQKGWWSTTCVLQKCQILPQITRVPRWGKKNAPNAAACDYCAVW